MVSHHRDRTRTYNNSLRSINLFIMTSKERHEARYQRRKATRARKRRERLGKYDDFDRLSSVSALVKAHFDSRKGVLWKASVARYDAKFFHNSIISHKRLIAGKDTRQGFYHFQIVERGKPRDVHSLHYSERVIRRSVCINAMVPILSDSLIFDNGASLKGKGVSFAIKECEKHLHDYWAEHRDNEGYALIIDFKSFFNNIQHEPMFAVYDHSFNDARLREICKDFVRACGSSGLYIGPEDSQISAIAYPSSIDHLIKDVWKIHGYGRYMDDSYIIHRNKDELRKIRDRLIAEFNKLGIIANPKKTQIVKLSRGFTFLKTQFFLQPSGKIVEKPAHVNIVRQRRKNVSFRRFCMRGMMTVEQVSGSYMSWRGSIKNKDARRTIHSMDRHFFKLFAVKPWIKKRKKRRKEIHVYGESS